MSKVDNLQKYEDVIKALNSENEKKHLLLGNGFSIAYDYNIFSYSTLSSFIEKLNDELLKKLFTVINTKNFELVMRQIDNFVEIAKVFSSDKQFVDKLSKAKTILKDSLINAIKELHPEHSFRISEQQSQSCFNFLNEFIANEGKIFSTNYDLLLYWVLMKNNKDDMRFVTNDGFSKEDNSDTLIWGKFKYKQNIFYLHGALHLFDTGIDVIKERYDLQHFILDNINARMEKNEYPIFITAGNKREKLNHIMHNMYLAYCYEQLTRINGSLIVFGFNFGEYDNHIIDAINKANMQYKTKLNSVYIGIYDDKGLEHIERIKDKFKCQVNLYNAKTAKIW